MKDKGIVVLKDVPVPVAVLRRTEMEDVFVGAFCSGPDKNDLTITIVHQREIDRNSYFKPTAPGVMKLKMMLAKLDPKIHKKVKSVFKKLQKIQDEEDEWNRLGGS